MKIYPQEEKTEREILVEKDYVEIKKSNIPGAGLGVFAKKDIQVGEDLGVYRGELLEINDDSYSNGDRTFAYTLRIDVDGVPMYVDAEHNVYNWISRVNSPKGTGMKSNIYWDSKGRTFTKRNIKAGEELLAGYGSVYWRGVNNKTLKKKPSKKNSTLHKKRV
jgi:hypothetical protein